MASKPKPKKVSQAKLTKDLKRWAAQGDQFATDWLAKMANDKKIAAKRRAATLHDWGGNCAELMAQVTAFRSRQCPSCANYVFPRNCLIRDYEFPSGRRGVRMHALIWHSDKPCNNYQEGPEQSKAEALKAALEAILSDGEERLPLPEGGLDEGEE